MDRRPPERPPAGGHPTRPHHTAGLGDHRRVRNDRHGGRPVARPLRPRRGQRRHHDDPLVDDAGPVVAGTVGDHAEASDAWRLDRCR
ncbi:MAG: hypothetical protein EBY52_02675, partial [Actinobacteria bacterium]|nr:hypothetical protein [Actinomycetota bacterium]